MDDLKKLCMKKKVGDVELAAAISPCSWMYPGYGFQIMVTMEPNGGSGSLINKPLAFEKATESDVRTLLDGVRITPCRKCGKPAFDPTSISTNRASKCEACFIAELNAEFAQATERENRKLQRLDIKYKGQGYTHRVDAWIHPVRGGDDRQISFYMVDPNEKQIKAEIKKSGSGVLDDYKIIPL